METGILRNFALKLTRNSEDAQDLIQDTLYKALNNREKFVDATNFRGWLLTIMRNIFINSYNRHTKHNEIINEKKDTILTNRLHIKSTNEGESIMTEKIINREIETLQQEFRVPFERHVEGYKYEEISEELHIPIGTVKSRIFMARKRLMEKLKELN